MNSNANIDNIKSSYLLKNIFDYIKKKKFLEIIKYNKNLQNKINLNIKDYKEYCETYTSIEIEIIPSKNSFYGKFINLPFFDKSHYHIYFNDDNKEETEKVYFDENVKKIKIIIDYEAKYIENLFNDCKWISSINFKKFYRTNIDNMSGLFCGCSGLKELNLSKLNTINVTDMSDMFFKCSSLEKLDLSNFNTKNVDNMNYMFCGCKSLKELNLSNFDTNKVIFMNHMFNGCTSLKELDISNFNVNEYNSMRFMFAGCSEDLKLKIKKQNKNLKSEAYKN